MFEPVIGLEIHAQLKTKSKLFCPCPTSFGGAPNTFSCPVCRGLPGALPVLNRKAVALALRFGRAIGAKIEPVSRFDRKNYFYPDLPKGYQITQFEFPILRGGGIPLSFHEPDLRVPLTRAHLEEDAGQLLHDGFPDSDRFSYINLNRAGIPLLEIVTEPALHDADQVIAFLTNLRTTLQILEVCDGTMEEGSFRCDVNISLRPRGSTTFGTRTELKNLNSFQHVRNAVMFEIHRQTALLAHGEAVTQVTLLWDPDHQVARVMRGKEDSEDYRYFPDPDLSELHLEALGLEDPESGRFAPPWETFRHLQEEEGLTADDALFVLQHPEFRALFTAVRAEMPPLFPPNHTLNFIRTDLTGLLRGAPLLVQKKATRKSPCPPPSEIAALSQWVGEERISGKMAKIALKHLVDHPGITAQAALDAEGLSRVCGDTEVEVHIQGILRDFPEVIQQIREGREKAFGFLMGQLMTRSNGTLPPQKAQAALKRTISQATEIPEGR